MMLEVTDLNVYYGNIRALKDVSFSVEEGEIMTLIGANGAGKTTKSPVSSNSLFIRDLLGRLAPQQ